MKTLNLIFVCMVFSGGAYSQVRQSPEENTEIKYFTDIADNCDYLSGEWDSDLTKKRQREIEKQVDRYCSEVSRLKEKLKQKYKGHPDIESILNGYDFE
ncbi:membrane protein precursor [Tatumella morbirosei]|uniref:Membrane protein n=1 Tax=Tatumella morbirosei TaxID=642227 RepID=A0A095TF21_9GAMM|nr:hypothetical protein [Tatumella morbirosei]KGD75292.1 membrane protein precursor [Tatumella morbirosei]